MMEKVDKAEMEVYWNELVDIQLFKDNGRYKDDVCVWVDGEKYVIKRGERLKVKRKVAEILTNVLNQDNEMNLKHTKHKF